MRRMITENDLTNLDNKISDTNKRIDKNVEDIDINKKQIKNHDIEIANINDIIRSTVATEVEEDFDGRVIDVPKTVTIENQAYTVIDNQIFRSSKLTGETRKSYNNFNIQILNDYITSIRPYEQIKIENNNIVLSNTSNSEQFTPSGVIKLKPNTEYTISCDIIGTFTGRLYRFFGNSIYERDANSHYTFTFTTNDDGTMTNTNDNFINIYQNIGDGISYNVTSANGKLILANIIVAEGKVEKPYEPYWEGLKDSTISNIESFDQENNKLGETLTVNMSLKGAGTVGDEILVEKNSKSLYDVKLVRKMKEITVDSSFEHNTNLPLPSDSFYVVPKEPAKALSNNIIVNYDSYSQRTDSRGQIILVFNKQFDRLSDFEAFIYGKKIIYELATPEAPVTIATDLTLDQVSVLAKQNGYIKVNSMNPDEPSPRSSFRFNINYWEAK